MHLGLLNVKKMKNEKEQEKGMKKGKERGTKSYFSFIRSFNQSYK